jgi:glycogen operon protein
MINAYWEPLGFELPPAASGAWRRCIDTALISPEDIRPWSEAPAHPQSSYLVSARSLVLLALAQEPD